MPSTNLLRFGSASTSPAPLALRAGPLTMLFEPDTGFLRYLRLGDHELVRSIYGVVRDHDWNTIAWQVSNLQTAIAPDSFRLTFDVTCREREIDYTWQGTVTGDAQGNVSFTFEGASRSAFRRNRIGLCVLHPPLECAGKSCVIEHWDGTTEPGSFPRHVWPVQTCKNIRSLEHDAAPGVRVKIQFDGEVFEMEDQRNYADASFKTYSTPQELPKPAAVAPGDRVHHEVTVALTGEARKILPVLQGRPPQLSIATTPVLPKPPLGLRLAAHGRPLTPREVERLRSLRLAHLQVDLHLARPDWPTRLRLAAHESAQIGAALHLALWLSHQAETGLDAVRRELDALRPNVSLFLVYHSDEPAVAEKWIRLAREKLSNFAPNTLFAAGHRPFFNTLNCQRPEKDSAALPCFPIAPQVHLRDHRTLVENLGALPTLVESARQFSPQAAVISPITLRPVYSLPGTAEDAPGVELPAGADARQMSLFGAAWTLGSLARLAAAGPLHSLTYFETTGAGGVMETEVGSPWPEKFPSLPGGVYPVFHLLADLAGFDRIYPTFSSHPLQVEGLTLLDAQNRRRILVANLTGETQEIKIKTGTGRARVRLLDETSAAEAMRSPEAFRAGTGAEQESVSGKIELKLLPCALARIDFA